MRSTPGQIQLSIERVDTVGEDDRVEVACEDVALEELDVTIEEDEELEVVEIELELETGGMAVVDEIEVDCELLGIALEVVLVVVVLLGSVAT